MSLGMGGGLATDMAPSLNLPFRYFAAALAFLAVFGAAVPFLGGLLLGGYLQPQLLALVHTVTLGWITTTIIGATFQLVPVALQVPIGWQRLAGWMFFPYLAGVVTLIAGFWLWETGLLAVAAGLLLLAALMYLAVMARTLSRVRRWDVIAVHVAAVFGHLAVVVALAVALILHARFGFLGAAFLPTLQSHALLAVGGFVSVLIMGVAYKLVPMFTLTEDLLSERLAWWAFGLWHVGLAGVVIGWFGGGVLGLIGAVALLAGGGLFGWQMARLYRRRRRRVFDISTPFTQGATLVFVTALLVGALAVAGLIPASPRLWMALGFFTLLGWVGQITLGMTYKITTFLVWLNKYAALIGQQPVPRLDDLYSRDVALVSWGLWNAGLLIGTAVIATHWPPLMLAAGLCLAVSSGLFVVNMGLIATR